MASDAEREHFRRIGEAKARLREEDLREHLARTPEERLAYSIRMMFEGLRRNPNPDRSDDNPEQFYERARRLGLYDG
ncbi:MAG: hypothetical protein Kow0010_05100 [Dehalococcoidia bacterium]